MFSLYLKEFEVAGFGISMFSMFFNVSKFDYLFKQIWASNYCKDDFFKMIGHERLSKQMIEQYNL